MTDEKDKNIPDSFYNKRWWSCYKAKLAWGQKLEEIRPSLLQLWALHESTWVSVFVNEMVLVSNLVPITQGGWYLSGVLPLKWIKFVHFNDSSHVCYISISSATPTSPWLLQRFWAVYHSLLVTFLRTNCFLTTIDHLPSGLCTGSDNEWGNPSLASDVSLPRQSTVFSTNSPPSTDSAHCPYSLKWTKHISSLFILPGSNLHTCFAKSSLSCWCFPSLECLDFDQDSQNEHWMCVIVFVS